MKCLILEIGLLLRKKRMTQTKKELKTLEVSFKLSYIGLFYLKCLFLILGEGADSALKEEEKSNQVNTPRLTLNEIMQLIQEGKEVPGKFMYYSAFYFFCIHFLNALGIREIPNKVNEKPASLSKLEPRIKPWMK